MWLVWKAKTTKEERDVAFKTGLVHLPEGPAPEEMMWEKGTGCGAGSSGRPPKQEGSLWIQVESSKAQDFVVM